MFCPACQSEWPAEWKVCPKDATNLLRSARIGKYSIEGLLGVGGMGAVYRATNPDTKGAVAIKVMNPAVAASDALRARFQREAGVVAKLRTSHVTKVYDFGTDPEDGMLFLVMELLDGHTLREEITPGPDYMDLARVAMVLEGSLKGLAAAHKVGIVHRDLKPENIYIADTDDGEIPKLLDFGIARVRTRDSDLTGTGALMGTASYMAPEQVTAQGEIGPWTDVYAMGGILYECLAGTSAVGGATVTEVLQRVMRSDIVSLRSVRAGLPEAIYEVVDRCMAADPTKRPQDAEAMRALLASARLVSPGAAVPPPAKTRTDVPIVPDVRSSPALQQTAAQGSGSAFGPTVRAGTGPTTPLEPVKQATPVGGYNPSGARAALASLEAAASHTSSNELHAPAKKKSIAPILAIAGVVVIGGGIAAFALTRGSNGTTKQPDKKIDAGVAPPPIDAAQVAVAIDATTTAPKPDAAVVADDPNDPRKKMVHLDAGERSVGDDHPDGMPRVTVAIDEFWIDPAEMTLGEFRAATKSSAGGTPRDKPDFPVRKITYAQAEAACKALGKRLPTEPEWEAAALTTPQDPKLALPAKSVDLAASKHEGDCSSAGLCDMLGSVAEWTATDDVKAKGNKIVRGATYALTPDNGWEATIHARHSISPVTADDEVGVRCAVSTKKGPKSE